MGIQGGWREVFARGYRAPLATISLGVGLYALNAFLVATALPSAVRDIGGLELMSWSVAVFLVLAIVGGASASLLKARHGAALIITQRIRSSPAQASSCACMARTIFSVTAFSALGRLIVMIPACPLRAKSTSS